MKLENEHFVSFLKQTIVQKILFFKLTEWKYGNRNLISGNRTKGKDPGIQAYVHTLVVSR